MSIYYDDFQNMFWKWSQLPPIRDQNILDSDEPPNILPRQNTILAKWHVMTTIICCQICLSHWWAISIIEVCYDMYIYEKKLLRYIFLHKENHSLLQHLFCLWPVHGPINDELPNWLWSPSMALPPLHLISTTLWILKLTQVMMMPWSA
jgi:hypothetical protein